MQSADLDSPRCCGILCSETFRRSVSDAQRILRSPSAIRKEFFLRREGESEFVVCVTHIGVGVLRLCFGKRGVTVRAVVFTEVIRSLRVGGDQQLLDVSLSAEKKYRFIMELDGTF